jgi:hypothetical protein
VGKAKQLRKQRRFERKTGFGATQNIDNALTQGVLIVCTIEDAPQEGAAVWINLLEVEDSEDIQNRIDALTGRAVDPYPETWNEYGTFEVQEVRGLGPRLSALASDAGGPLLVETLADLAEAIQSLPSDQVEDFLAWAEGPDGTWWLPGYASNMGGQLPADAVLCFVIHREDSDET